MTRRLVPAARMPSSADVPPFEPYQVGQATRAGDAMTRSPYLHWTISGPYRKPSLLSRFMRRLGWFVAGVS